MMLSIIPRATSGRGLRTRLSSCSLADVHTYESRAVHEPRILLAVERRVRAEGERAVLPAELPDDVPVRAVDVVERASVAYSIRQRRRKSTGLMLFTWMKRGSCRRYPCRSS